MAGGAGITKSFGLVRVPLGTVTVIFPVVVPAGTVVLIWLPEITVKLAGTPLKATAVAPVSSLPKTVTAVPTGPLIGVKEWM